MRRPPAPARLLDAALDRLVVPGYSRLGPALRHRWWPADPPAGALAGKRVLVTGATSGIGEAMVDGFLALGAAVHVLGRNGDKTQALVARLRAEHAGADVEAEVCDIGDLDAVRTWAAGFTGRVGALHGLVHNAGALPAERSETAQGHETTLAVHVLGPHLMTSLLADTLVDDASSVVWMSSGGMYGARLRDDDLEFRTGEYSGVRAYARTKRMQVVLAARWADRLAGRRVRVESTHPGWVDTAGVTSSLPGFGKAVGPLLRTAAEGADTTVWLVATRPPSTGEHFWHDRAQRPSTLGWERGQDPAAVTRFLDQVAAATGTPA
ncbi:dehydrogenase [Geodermatophilus sp. Leaf369]|uniref:SDR family NAD(P)-dependent oxidoreductase n=1 Tax=Geodermatophilus sp. Leaf369 TaxID=1736354 RepID=UPI0006F98B61|nr:SDR family NAD(P)-dependent oxidoreductase [Geodermatophilus sp. Leaf369]KQS58476.1 dehydrogenase [Geodermatophilus sp. Leaf369]